MRYEILRTPAMPVAVRIDGRVKMEKYSLAGSWLDISGVGTERRHRDWC